MSLIAVFSAGFQAQPGNDFSPAVKNTGKKAQVTINKDYGKMPLSFIPNQGQMDRQVYFYLQGKDKSVYFTSEGVTYSLNASGGQGALFEKTAPWTPTKALYSRHWVVKLEFVDARKEVKPECLDKSGTVISYFKGQPKDWQSGLQAASKIIYRDLWPGIDLVYYGTFNRMKYEFIVHPGADPARIKLAYRGAASVKENSQGQLEVQTPAGGFFDDTPIAWQEIAGKRESVVLKYAVEKKAPSNPQDTFTYGFSVGTYDKNETLILDPAVIVYCGYIGGGDEERGYAIAVDAAGCAYVTGWTYSNEASFPASVGPDLTFNASTGNRDAFVAKVKSDGTGLVYCGYIGGSSLDSGSGIAVDSSGCAYVTGETGSSEASFPVTVGPDLTHNGGWDAFVAKVKADGTGLLYCGYIGGANSDDIEGIAVDASGCAYLTGCTDSTETTFPVTAGPDLTYNGGGNDAFVAKVSTDGTGLVYCGYIGGTDADYGYDCDIAVDTLGCAYITGSTKSSEASFPVTVGPDLTFNGGFGDSDAFVAKLTADGTALYYCGYIGGSTYDYSYGIAVDGSGCVYITGNTQSTEATFPVTVGPDLTYNANRDSFVAKIKADGTALDYCGYIGGSDVDYGAGIAVDDSGCAHIIGYTMSSETSFPVTVGPDITYNGSWDAFVAKIKADGSALDYCGYIGGSDVDFGYDIALDSLDCAYITGYSQSYLTTIPVIVGPDLTYNGGCDAYVAKISGEDEGAISGTVKDSLGNGINNVAVRVYDLSNNYYSMYTTDSSGAYSLTPIPAGNWKVYFDTLNAGNYLDEWYNDKSGFDSADQVSVSAGQTTTLSDAVLIEGGIISGRVTDSLGTGLESVSIFLYDLNENFVINGYTDSSGNYSLEALTAGTYKVEYSPSSGNYLGEWYNNKIDFASADQVSVTLGQTTALADTVLVEGGIISGRVTDSLGNGLLNVDVYAWGLTGNVLGYIGTDSSGYYTLEGIRPGNCKVSFETYGQINYISEFYNDKSDWGSADTVSVTAGQTTNLPDAVLTEGGAISGRVTDSLANGIENVGVYVSDLNHNLLTSGYTDANGDYTVMAVLPGGCKIYFDTYSVGNYLEEWYNDQGSFNDADTVTVTAGSTTTDIDAQLVEGGIISGKVMDSSLVGIEYVMVRIYDLNNNWINNVWTDINGDYSVQRLLTGSYKIYFDTWNTSNSYLCEWYNDKDDFASANAVAVTAGSTITNINAVLADGGAITGRVTDSTGTVGIANVNVQVCDLVQYWLYGTSTDSNGYYTINAIPTGSYKVQFNTDSVSGNYVREWYNDQVTFNDADVVNVTNGTVTSGIDAQLADGGSMSGRVTDSGNNGIGNVNVNVHDLNGNNISWSSTDSNGDYTVKGIPTGNHKVQFGPWNAGNYIEEWYNDKNSFNNGDTAAITAGQTTTGIDAQLADGGAISGRVTDATGTVGIENVQVQVCDLANYWYNGASTDSGGYYTIQGLPGGDYKVEFRTNWTPGNYVGEWYNDKGSFENADVISVTVGQTTTGIDAQLADGGGFSGRVTDATGTVGLANVNVQACDLTGYWYYGVNTDADGYYTLYGLPAGSYKIQFATNNTAGNYVGEWYNDKNTFENADAVSITVGQTAANIDAQLADGGAISGRVTDTGNNGIANINVNVYDLNNNYITSSSTNSDGDYTVRGVAAGNCKVRFWVDSAGNYISEWYNNQGSFATADAVSVTVGNTTANIDAQLADSGAISGRVTDSTGTVGIANVNIQVCDLTQYYLYGSSTDSNGYYTVYGVAGGSYKVEFRTGSTPGNYAGEWYNNRGNFNDADTVIVANSAVTAGIDAQLANGGSISGRVTDSGSNGIANVNVNVHDMNGNNIAWATTDSNGDYTVKGISSGNRKVQFWPYNAGNYMEEWYNNRGSFNDADAVLVIAGETNTGIDAQLADSGAVSGRVTDSTGTVGIASVSVQICDLNGYWYNGTGTDNDGYYTIRGLPAGDYKVEFRTQWGPGYYVGEWYNDKNSFESADTISVTLGQTTTGIDAQLADSGAISGRVTDSTGTVGIASVDVQACDLNGYWYYGVNTDSSGYYTLYGLPAGNYKIQFTTNWAVGNYVGEWYNDKNAFESADTVSVTVGVTTTDIDAQLADGGAISGRVTDGSNNGIENVNVNIYDLNNSDNCVNSTATDSSGNYTVPGLAPGDYKVQFWPGNAGNYLEEWYNNQGSFNDADVVTVSAGSTTTGIDAQLATGGTIHGKVMDSSLLGIQNVQVSIYDLNFNWIKSTWTDGLGDYTFQGLDTENYKIYFDTWNTGNSYLREWYNNADEFDNATEVAVTAGQATNNVNAVLEDGGAVSGRVTDSGGTLGIANVGVQICDLNGYWHPGVNTDSDGYYTLTGIPGGDYNIQFQAYWVPGNYVSEWYNDQDSFENADVVTVTVGQTTAGIDAQLADGGGVSGRVTDSSGTVGIANVYVNICDMNQQWLHCIGTDNDGYYTIYGVPDGSFKIQFDPHDAGNYALEWWNNKRRFEDADTVIVTTGNTVTDINAQLEQAGSITGTVTDDSSASAIENVRVYVYDLINNEMGNCWTDASGNYTVGNLYPGNFKVFFETSNVPVYIEEWYNDQDSFANANEVTVNEGAATTVDAALAAVQDDSYEPNNDFNSAAEVTTGTLSDLVYLSPQGAGVEQDWYKVYVGPGYAGQDLKVNIRVTSPYPQNPPQGWTSDLDFQIYDGTGRLLGMVLSGSDDETLYIVNVSEGWYYINLQYCSVEYGPGGTGVHADYAMTVELSDSFAIGYISGRVTNEQDQGIDGVPVRLLHSSNDWSISFPIITTDPAGNYTIGYGPGDYTLLFNYFHASLNPAPPNYVAEYYNDQLSAANAQVFSLHAGVSLNGIDAELMAGATIEGTLTHASGNPVVESQRANAVVFDINNPGSLISYSYNDANGNYSAKYLPPGTYKVRFRGRDENRVWYAREWYNNQASLGTGTDVIIASVGQVVSGINNQFSVGGILQGRVTDTGGNGIANVLVSVYSPSDPDNMMVSGYTDGNGDYYIREVFAGDVKIYFNADEQNTAYVSEWYNNQGDFNAANLVSITSGQTTSGIDAQLGDKGGISGRVTDSPGTTGIANVNVNINDLNGNWINGTNTDANGDYAINGIPAGDYKVEFNPDNAAGNYLRQWYNDKNSFDSADSVTVTNGQTTGGIDAQLADGAAISGRVTDASGTAGIENVEIRLYDSVQNHLQQNYTDSDGYYTIQGISAGSYKIQFRTHTTSGYYVDEWYNDKSTFNSADTLSVTAGQTLTGIDAQLADGGGISGRVTDSTGTQGIANVDVGICDLAQYWLPGISTDSDGYYTLKGLPAGDYKIEFTTNNASGNYSFEWYNDKSSFENADIVGVNVGLITTGIDAQLEEGGALSGRVTDSTGTVGIYNVNVQIYDLNNYWLNSVSTDSDGYYTLQGLPSGNYKIEFRTSWTPDDYVGEWYNDKDSFENADAVSVTLGQTTTGIDAQLAAGGSISGRVTDSTGTVGIYNVNVNICDLNQYWLPGVSTDSDGYYTLHGVPAGDYKIQFNPDNAPGNYVREWYNDRDSFENADPVTVTVGQTTTGIDAQLAEAGSISGQVTDSLANGIQNVDVRVYDSNNNYIYSVTTDSNGDYTIHFLPPGDCKVYFDTWGAGNYVPEWYNDKGAFDEADVVAITAGQTTGNIDAQLTDGSIISGQVTNESAAGIQGIRVRVVDLAGNWINAVDTDANGNYTVNRLAAGSYKVDFNPSFISEPYIREWYNDKTSLNTADPVEVTAGATTTIDAVLQLGGIITGRVTNDANAGIQNVRVDIQDMTNLRKAWAYTNANGDYTVKGFAAGSYKVYFNAYYSPANYIPEWYNDKNSFDNGDTISVNAGQTVTGIDAALAPGCSISGTVTDTSANPIELVEVYASDIAGNFIFGGYTDTNGNYEVNGLIPGSYKVFFYSYELNYYGEEDGFPRDYNYKYEWYNDKENFAAADMVPVTLQSPATGIDAVLAEDGGMITGHITDSLGAGIQGCRVFAFYAKDNYIDYYNSEYSDANGYYEVKGLPVGNYIVMFRPPSGSSYRGILYNNTLDPDNATEVPVLAGQTTSGIDAVLPKGGVITGRVTDGNGNGLGKVTLRLIDAATNKYLNLIGHTATTDVNGYYTIYAEPGQWKLTFQAWSISGNGYVSEFYNDRSIVENADILTVNPEETLANIDAVLSTGGGKISGYVKDSAGTDLYGVDINVYDTQYNYWIGNATTDPGGYFEVPGMIPGNYKIFTLYSDIYPVEWYSDKTSFATADVVPVTEGGNTEVIIILGGNDPGATAVTGRVTDYSGSGIENVNVNIYDPDNNFINSASTDSNGDYAVEGIPAGSYKVYFDTNGTGNYLAEWYQNKGAFDEADTITVATGQVLENIDAQLAEGGIISGRVMNEAEVGVEGVQVKVRDLDSNLITTANTDANGDYTIQRLPANSYKIYFDVNNANGYYVGQWNNNRDTFETADILVLTAGVTSVVDAILGDGMGISGTVTDGSANPLLDIFVEIYEPSGLYVTDIYTDSSGNYEIKGLAPGNYKVYFNPWAPNYHGQDWYGLPADTNYKFQWYTNKEYFADADVVTAAPGSAATGIDAVMIDNEGGIISGQITDSQANGIAGCFVYAFQGYDAQEWFGSDYMRTGADGNYQIKGLSGGDYLLLFTPPGGTNYRRQFYNNAMDRDLAAMVSVTAGQTTPGINAVLQKGGTVTGRVTDSSGKGLENVYIRLMAATTNKYLGYAGNAAQTDANGYYSMPAQPGQWKVMFQAFSMSNQGYVSEFYNNQSTVENGNIITVAAGETVANVNAVLSLGGGKISGFVKDPGNTGLDNAYIEVWDTQYQTFVGHTNADRNGYFEVHGLIPGNYKLYASYNRVYPFEWYSDETTFAAADELIVTNGGNTQVLVILGAPDAVLPSLQLTSPNGGESLTGGTTHNITWDVQGNIEAVHIQYSIDNGANWITIEPFAENTGIYQWTVPETPSENCLVRIGASDADAGPTDVSDGVFSIVTTGPASINLKSPNRWVSITAGTTQEITWYWTGGGAVDNIMLEYSIDSGQTWLMIVPGTANTGSYFWFVPDTPSEHCLVRIQVGEGDEVLSAISEMEFSIVTPSTPVLRVTSPNGGETWKVGYFYNIAWDTIGTIADVKLEYSINGGGNWTLIIASTPNTGSYQWTVPNSPSADCLIRVTDAAGSATDTGNESFTIEPASTATLEVTSPNGGESLTIGTTHDITWTSTGMENVESVMIEYSHDNGESWTTVVPGTAHNGTGGSYTWTIPDTPSETCLVRITDLSSDEGASDVSDAVFSIEPAPFITVISPNGGEQWQTGTTYAINWTYSGITGNVVIDLYRGTSFDCNITTTAVDTGSFDWNIPISFTNADDYKVLIYQNTIEDYSDNYFAISDQAPNNPDFNNDGSVDILWRNYGTGGNEVWLMNGAVRSSTVSLQAEAGLDWRIVGTGDFNRDGKVDLLWRNYTNGQNRVWYMNGTAVTGTASLPVQPDVNYQVAGAGDFNGDGSVDILWRHALEGRNQVWYMNGVTVTGYQGLPELKDTTWRIAGLGDFNDDDKVDILWRNYVTGYNQVWYMDGATRIGIVDLMENTDLTWQIAGTGDFNKDGKIDILWRRYSDGADMIWYMDGIVRIGVENIEARVDLTWRIVGNGDYKE